MKTDTPLYHKQFAWKQSIQCQQLLLKQPESGEVEVRMREGLGFRREGDGLVSSAAQVSKFCRPLKEKKYWITNIFWVKNKRDANKRNVLYQQRTYVFCEVTNPDVTVIYLLHSGFLPYLSGVDGGGLTFKHVTAHFCYFCFFSICFHLFPYIIEIWNVSEKKRKMTYLFSFFVRQKIKLKGKLTFSDALQQ